MREHDGKGSTLRRQDHPGVWSSAGLLQYGLSPGGRGALAVFDELRSLGSLQTVSQSADTPGDLSI